MPGNKKVLFIAYLFPPVGGSGVQRSSKFVKYLSDFGWYPLVLTVKEPYDFYNDESLMNDVKGRCTIYRTLSIEPMKWVRKFLKRKTEKRINTNGENNLSIKSLKPGILVKLKSYLLFPDNEILWLPFAVWKGWRIIKKEKPKIIYATASPYTDHLIALILSKLCRIPWVADFRDFWVDRPNFPQNKWRLFIDRKLEKSVINNADYIITATSLITNHFKKLYPESNYVTITNGFDEEDFSNVSYTNSAEDKFTITYTGIFNKERNPEIIFHSLNKLINNESGFKDELKIKIIGQLDNPGDFENINNFKKYGLDKYSDIISYQPHQTAINEMCKATILLLFIGEQILPETILTGKIFEYLRSQRPILAVVPVNGLAAEVIKETNSGLVVSRDSEEEIVKGILKLFDLYKRNELDNAFKRKNIEHYSRRNLTKDLTDVFERVINKNKL